MSQTVMNDNPAVAYPGLIADASYKKNVISRILNVMQLVEVAITGTTDGVYSILADGVAQASFNASSNTAEEIRDGLLADYATSSAVAAAAEASSTDKILIEQTDRDSVTDLAWTVTGPGGPDITVTELVSQTQKVPFGVGVVSDPRAENSGEQARLPRTSAEITGGTFQGISVGDVSYPNEDGTGYASQSSMPILRDGPIWVRTEDACEEGGQVFCRFADPTAAYGLGSFRSDADGSDAVALPGAMFRRTSVAGGLNQVELNPTR